MGYGLQEVGDEDMGFEYMSVLSQNMRLDHCRFLRPLKNR